MRGMNHMSALFCDLIDERGKEAHKQAHQKLTAHIRGWNGGIRVYAIHDKEHDCDAFQVVSTGGSNGDDDKETLVSILVDKNGEITVQ
jgi:hypothetical protein